MKKHVLLTRMLALAITAGLVLAPLQSPLSTIAAEAAAEEVSTEEESATEEDADSSEAPTAVEAPEEKTTPNEEVSTPDSEHIEQTTEDKSSKEEESEKEDPEKPKEKMADEEAESKDTKTPEEAPCKSDESSAKDDADGSEDEIIEEIAEDEACIDACNARPTYNDVFATLKGSGYSLSQARNSAQTVFNTGQYMYIWAWLHDANGNLYKRYGSGTVNMTLAIYRPDGSCAYKYTYNNSDNNWIGVRLDKPGTWRIQSNISGALTGNNIRTVTVQESARTTYNDVFATLKGSGYSLSQARNSAQTVFTTGQLMYIWAWLHDANGNLYKSYGSGTVNMTLAIYRPDGSCAYKYTYKNSDNNWIGVKLDKPETWKIQSTISGAKTGNNIRTVTVKNAPVITPTSVKIGNGPKTMNIGDSKSLTATVSPSNATNKGVTWKSSNTSVLAVSSSGKLTAKKAGTAKITVTTKANGKTASITVTVKAKSNGGTEVYNKAKSFLGKKYSYFSGKGFHYRAWCADFVSYCAKLAGQSKAIPKNATVAGIRNAIKNAGGKEYSKAKVKNGSYVPKRGDIIIFKSNGASHVGIVDYASKGYIYYIDGNNTTNGNGYSARVHYSKCKNSDSRFTCILHPKY